MSFIKSPSSTLNNLQFERGNWVINKMRVVRQPLAGFAQKLGRMVVGEPINQDKFFHLWTEFDLINPDTGEHEIVAVEKNERINVMRQLEGGIKPNAEGVNVDLNGKTISLNEYLYNNRVAHGRAGRSFDHYSLKNANCSVFTHMGLRGNGLELENENVMNFIRQPIAELLPSWAERLTNFITDTARNISDMINPI